MSGANESRANTTNQTSSSVVNAAISGDVRDSGIAIAGSELSNVEFTTTDHGTVARAFDAFDRVIDTSDNQSQRTLSAITKNTDNTVAALKDFAEKLTVGDIESAKYISYAIIAAVLIALIVFLWKK